MGVARWNGGSVVGHALGHQGQIVPVQPLGQRLVLPRLFHDLGSVVSRFTIIQVDYTRQSPALSKIPCFQMQPHLLGDDASYEGSKPAQLSLKKFGKVDDAVLIQFPIVQKRFLPFELNFLRNRLRQLHHQPGVVGIMHTGVAPLLLLEVQHSTPLEMQLSPHALLPAITIAVLWTGRHGVHERHVEAFSYVHFMARVLQTLHKRLELDLWVGFRSVREMATWRVYVMWCGVAASGCTCVIDG